MTGSGPTTLRIAHLADTHLGYSAYGKTDPATGRNQRAVDVENAFERAISDILERDVDLVLHAGDVFHHTRPSWSTLTHFVRQMRRLERAGLPAVVIAGNHDTEIARSTPCRMQRPGDRCLTMVGPGTSCLGTGRSGASSSSRRCTSRCATA